VVQLEARELTFPHVSGEGGDAVGGGSATVLRYGMVMESADRFLAHLTAIERSPTRSGLMAMI
jgi:hypothetical protein